MKDWWSKWVFANLRLGSLAQPILFPRRTGFSFILHLPVFILVSIICFGTANAQTRTRSRKASVCGNPTLACKTSATFQPYDLPFRVPQDAVIYDTELFYAIILKSVGTGEQDCEVFVPESERLDAQALFPSSKVFTSRCPDVETLFYSNVRPQHRFMAAYAGATLVEAKRVLAAVKATGKFPGATIRRMRTGFNGT
ncbi:MAG: hypothetical protein JWM21_4606 [Acidobacteria bacterium]|nr:hypothetical protein [Acidobacteriota bacterium]